MRVSNAEFMRLARESLRGKWGLAVGVAAAYFGIIILLQQAKDIGSVAMIAIAGPLAGGIMLFSLTLSRGGDARFELLFGGFRRYTTYLAAYWLVVLYVLLWSLLLIVPGIVAAISYAMTYFVIADDPSISASDALRRSRELMKGNRWRYVLLSLRFLGWALLSLLSFGIGFLWLIPYVQVSMAKFYDDLRKAEEPEPVMAPEPEKAPTEVVDGIPENGVIDGGDAMPEAA